MELQLYSRKRVIEITSLSGVTLWRQCKNGSFPAPLRIGLKRIAWRSADLKAWLAGLRHVDGSSYGTSGERASS